MCEQDNGHYRLVVTVLHFLETSSGRWRSVFEAVYDGEYKKTKRHREREREKDREAFFLHYNARQLFYHPWSLHLHLNELNRHDAGQRIPCFFSDRRKPSGFSDLWIIWNSPGPDRGKTSNFVFQVSTPVFSPPPSHPRSCPSNACQFACSANSITLPLVTPK